MKRLLLLAILIPGTAWSERVRGEPWTCSRDNIASDPFLCISAPPPGMRRYITDIIAQGTTATADVLQLSHSKAVAFGGAPDCAEGNTGIFFAWPEGASMTRFQGAGNTTATTVIQFRPPLVLPPGRDLCVNGGINNPMTVQVIGYTAP